MGNPLLKGKVYSGRVWESNLINDMYTFGLQDWAERGAGGGNVMFEMTESSLGGHLSQFPVGTYKKAHVHGGGTQILMLSGQGYSLLWPRAGGKRIVIPWHKGSLFVPPDDHFHQHFNTGPEPARYLTFTVRSLRHGRVYFRAYQRGEPAQDIKEGGTQIEYRDEDPEIRRLFEAELARTGVTSKMPAVSCSEKQ